MKAMAVIFRNPGRAAHRCDDNLETPVRIWLQVAGYRKAYRAHIDRLGHFAIHCDATDARAGFTGGSISYANYNFRCDR
jgi:hypothetical protein